MPPPPPPREVRHRPGANVGLWVIRVFIFPHTLIGIGLIGAMLFLPIWCLNGTNSATPATRVWTTRAKNTTRYHVQYVDPVSGKLTSKNDLGREEYERLARLLPQNNGAQTAAPSAPNAPAAATVTVKTLKVGAYSYSDVIETGSSGWKKVLMIWGIGLFWNAVIGIFAFMIYVLPSRDKKLRRDGEASPGRIVEKTAARRSKGGTQYVLAYAFAPTGQRASRARAGGEVTAQQHVTKAEWDAAAEGDEVWVLHWPGKATPSVLYDMGTWSMG